VMNEPRNCRPAPPFLFSAINCAAPSTTDINQTLITAGNRATHCAMHAINVLANVPPAFSFLFVLSPRFSAFLITIVGREAVSH